MVQVSTVKSCLEGWREPVIHLDALLGWEKDFYPAITAGVLTLKFIFYWYWDPTLITFFAFLGLCLTLCDFIGPKILGQIFKPDSWTGEKEKKFDVACSEMVSLFSTMEQGWTACREAREKKPVVHFAGTVTALVSMAWIGNRINSFFLLYLLTLTAVMLPGLHRRGLLKKYFSMITLKVSEAMGKGGDGHKKAE